MSAAGLPLYPWSSLKTFVSSISFQGQGLVERGEADGKVLEYLDCRSRPCRRGLPTRNPPSFFAPRMTS